MSARFNSLFLNQTTFDSASPLGSVVLVHRFDDEGEYDVELGREGEVPDRVALSVTPEVKEAKEVQAPSVTIDAAGAAPGTIAAQRRSKLHAGGYAAFTSMHARSSGSVIVARKRGEKDAEFDSRRLGEHDLFAVTLVRPGLYAVRNTLAKAKAEGRIVVTYPVVGPPTRWTWCAPRRALTPSDSKSDRPRGSSSGSKPQPICWSSCSNQTMAPKRGPGGGGAGRARR
jgi:hypothetical protein